MKKLANRSLGMEEGIVVVKGEPIEGAVFTLFDRLREECQVPKNGTFIIKPNLVSDYPPPITTPTDVVGALIDAIRSWAPSAQILIGEGTASIPLDTWEVFSRLGYLDLSSKKGVELLDLNEEGLLRLEDDGHSFFKEIWLPKVVFDAFLISVPVLKAHTLAGVTLSMKNMVGLLPPKLYQEKGHWKKSFCHRNIQRAIYELNRFRSPDLTILDARRGLSTSHLSGPELDPPPGIVCGGKSCWKVDAYGAGLLGRDWRTIEHIFWASKDERFT